MNITPTHLPPDVIQLLDRWETATRKQGKLFVDWTQQDPSGIKVFSLLIRHGWLSHEPRAYRSFVMADGRLTRIPSYSQLYLTPKLRKAIQAFRQDQKAKRHEN